MPAYPGFIGDSGTRESLVSDAEDTTNFYLEKLNTGRALFPTPGFSAWSQVADVGGRGSLCVEGRQFQIVGSGFYEIDDTGNATKRGTVALDGNPAQIVYNGKVGGQLGIASGGNGYCFVLSTNTLTQVLTGDCTMIAYAGGFGLAFNIHTGRVRLSDLNDFTTWDAGTFFQRSLFADPWQTMFADANNLIWLLGTDSFEVWYNTGVGTQPWAPLSGLVGRYGIAAPFAFGLSGMGNVWLARNPEGVGQVVLTRGSSPQPVSTYPISTAIASYLRTSRIDDAEVFTYHQEGHTFAILSFPSASATWAYDLELHSWCRRGKWNPLLGTFDLWAPRTHCYAFGKQIIGDRTTGILSHMDTSFTTEVDGTTGIVRERIAPGLLNEHKRVPITQFELLMDTGVGTLSGQGSNPAAMLSVSDDGGRTYGNERRASIGRMGAFRQRVYWNQLGAPAHAVLKVRFSDPAPIRITDAWLNNAEQAA